VSTVELASGEGPAVLRPMTIAEIFDRAVTLVVKRWRAAIVITAIGAIPSTVAAALIVGASMPGLARSLAVPFAILAFLLVVVGSFLTIASMAALTLLFAGTGDRPDAVALFGAALRRLGGLFLVSLLSGVVGFLCAAVGGLAVGIAALFGPIGIVIVGIVALLFVIAPLFASQLAFFDAVLEQTGPSTSISTAFRRVFRPGQQRRATALGAAVGLIYLAPVLVIEAAGSALATLPGLHWVPVVAAPLELMLGLSLLSATMTVAAIDYRLRSEGTDLRAALDAPAPE